MKITGTQTLEIEITNAEKQRIALAFLYEKAGWKETYFVRDFALMDRVWMHTSHSFYEDKVVREATVLDLAINSVLETF